jgi:hypothetical protein
MYGTLILGEVLLRAVPEAQKLNLKEEWSQSKSCFIRRPVF